jgi:hypothetical protein
VALPPRLQRLVLDEFNTHCLQLLGREPWPATLLDVECELRWDCWEGSDDEGHQAGEGQGQLQQQLQELQQQEGGDPYAPLATLPPGCRVTLTCDFSLSDEGHGFGATPRERAVIAALLAGGSLRGRPVTLKFEHINCMHEETASLLAAGLDPQTTKLVIR